MATLDDINILDRVKTDPQLLLQAGRQPTVERVKPTFNPASDYFYNNVLNDSGRKMLQFAKSEANNPLNFLAGAGMIGKANKVRQGIASLPPTLTRNPSKAEIKQNFIDQHPPVGSIDSKTGKPVTEQLIKNRANAFEKQLKVPAVRNREELRMSTTKISGVDEPLERIIKTPEDLLGKVLVPVTGDRSRVISGGMDDIRGIPLIQNIPVQGGPNYMIQHAGSGKAWASMENAANKKQMNMLFAADETGLDPYGVYSAMGRESINFSAPVATAMVAQLPALNIPKKHIKAFNETIRKGIGKTQEGRPDFVGLDSDDVFNQLLGTGSFPQKGAGN
jgi:hypothetical protein